MFNFSPLFIRFKVRVRGLLPSRAWHEEWEGRRGRMKEEEEREGQGGRGEGRDKKEEEREGQGGRGEEGSRRKRRGRDKEEEDRVGQGGRGGEEEGGRVDGGVGKCDRSARMKCWTLEVRMS
eukprot:767894-Hanusia_phi.AAC.6